MASTKEINLRIKLCLMIFFMRCTCYDETVGSLLNSFFFFLTLDPARAMSFAGAFTAPSFAFMGVTFPVTDMNALAQAWRGLLPISHYIEAQISQVSYGVTAWQTMINFTPPMLGYSIPLLLILLLVQKHLRKLDHES